MLVKTPSKKNFFGGAIILLSKHDDREYSYTCLIHRLFRSQKAVRPYIFEGALRVHVIECFLNGLVVCWTAFQSSDFGLIFWKRLNQLTNTAHERATMTMDWQKESFLKIIEIHTNSISIHISYIVSGCFDYKLFAFTFWSSSATNIHTVCKLNVASIWCYFQIYRVFWLKIIKNEWLYHWKNAYLTLCF